MHAKLCSVLLSALFFCACSKFDAYNYTSLYERRMSTSIATAPAKARNIQNSKAIKFAAASTAASCQSQVLHSLSQQTPHPAIWWLHIPKCGSSFSNSAVLYPRSKYRSPFPVNNKKPSTIILRLCRTSDIESIE
jgi:hypothetical protein